MDTDLLRMCFHLRPASEAPSDFVSTEGDGRMLLELNKAENKPDD